MRNVLLLLVLIGVLKATFYGDASRVYTYWSAVLEAPAIFLGTSESPFPSLLTALIAFLRLTTFALFISVVVRRLARR